MIYPFELHKMQILASYQMNYYKYGTKWMIRSVDRKDRLNIHIVTFNGVGNQWSIWRFNNKIIKLPKNWLAWTVK